MTRIFFWSVQGAITGFFAAVVAYVMYRMLNGRWMFSSRERTDLIFDTVIAVLFALFLIAIFVTGGAE